MLVVEFLVSWAIDSMTIKLAAISGLFTAAIKPPKTNTALAIKALTLDVKNNASVIKRQGGVRPGTIMKNRRKRFGSLPILGQYNICGERERVTC